MSASPPQLGYVAVGMTDSQQRMFLQLQAGLIDESKMTGLGYSTDPHVIIYCGLSAEFDADSVRAALRDPAPAVATAGVVRVNKSTNQEDDADCVVLTLRSPDLLRMRTRLVEAIGPDLVGDGFSPTVIIAYVQPNSHDYVDGMDVADTDWLFDELVIKTNNLQTSQTFQLNSEEDDDDD